MSKNRLMFMRVFRVGLLLVFLIVIGYLIYTGDKLL